MWQIFKFQNTQKKRKKKIFFWERRKKKNFFLKKKWWANSLPQKPEKRFLQRLGIAMALLGEPELLILDEPTNGLDPIGIEELRELIRSFPEQGITVILSSHILSEVQLLADKVGIISGGILGYEGALKQGDNLEDLFMNVVRKNRKEGEIHG